MSTNLELVLEKKAAMEAQLKLCNAANAVSREFSDSERLKFEQLESVVKSVTRQLADGDGYDGIRAELKRMGALGPSGGAARGAWGDAFFKEFRPAYGSKQLLTPSGSVGVPALSTTIPAVGELGRLETLLQAIKVTPSDNASAEYLREVLRTHAAAPVAEGATKPTSTYEIEEVVAGATVIAHLSGPHPRSWFADAPGLSKYLNEVLKLGLKLAVETQCILGNNTAPQWQGMTTVAGHQVQGFVTDILVTARMAITLLEVINVPDDLTFVFHPNDWEGAELLETGLGQFKMNDGDARAPINRQLRTLWGVPVVLSCGMPECTGLLFSKSAVEMFERQSTEITWSENVYDSGTGKTDFEKNLIRWRAEMRGLLAIYRPAAIVVLDVCAGS